MVDFGHSLFGLPFAYLGAILAFQGIPSIEQLTWITVAMISARTAALCLNRLIDRKIDRSNPRTKDWEMARGEFSPRIIFALSIVLFAILFYAAWQLNPLCFYLAPVAVFVLWIYSYTKRFTWLCHYILGLAISIGPVGGWIAITGTFDWEILFLATAVATWVAGFDMMYACQDIEFDRKQGLFSIPAKFGAKGALLISAASHFLTLIFLIINGLIFELHYWYYLGLIITAVILLYEHKIVGPGRLKNVNFASFHLNRYVGIIIFIFSLVEILS